MNTPDTRMTLIVDGERLPFSLEEVTARDVSKLRAETGRSLGSLIEELTKSPDLDSVAALAWLSRRQTNDKDASFDDIAGSLTYQSEFTVEVGGELPEA